jgi:hypothetical protein
MIAQLRKKRLARAEYRITTELNVLSRSHNTQFQLTCLWVFFSALSRFLFLTSSKSCRVFVVWIDSVRLCSVFSPLWTTPAVGLRPDTGVLWDNLSRHTHGRTIKADEEKKRVGYFD